MKHLFRLMFVVLLSVSFAACGGDQGTVEPPPDTGEVAPESGDNEPEPPPAIGDPP